MIIFLAENGFDSAKIWYLSSDKLTAYSQEIISNSVSWPVTWKYY